MTDDQDIIFARVASARPAAALTTAVLLDEEERRAMFERIVSVPSSSVDATAPHPPVRRLAVVAAVVAVAAAVAAVAVLLLLSSGPGGLQPAAAAVAHGPTPQARVVNALAQARDDVVKTDFTATFYGSKHGHKGPPFRVIVWSNGVGTRSVEHASGGPYVLISERTVLAVDPKTKTWSVSIGASHSSAHAEPNAFDPSFIRAEVRSGVLTVAGPGSEI
jgi:hypothetical protein